PTGSRDPFGMRRAGNGVLRVLVDVTKLTGLNARPRLNDLLGQAFGGYSRSLENWSEDEHDHALFHQFWTDRTEYVLESRGFDRRSVRAVARGEVRPADMLENL